MSLENETEENEESPGVVQRLVTFAQQRISKLVKSNIDHDQILGLIRVHNHFETVEMGSKRSESWLHFVHNQNTSEIHQDTSYKRAMSMIRTQAQFRDTSIETLHNRIAMINNSIYYDLKTNDWKLVEISQNKVEIVEMNLQTPLFERKQHQREQVEYVIMSEKDSLGELVELLRIQPQFQQIFKIHVISMFLGDVPVPIMVTKGEQGSLKTTITKAVKRIVDPSGEEISSIPPKRDDLVLLLNNRFVPNFDNVSFISPTNSDILCRAVTGDGLSKRKLYSDSTEVIYSYKRKIILNGISFGMNRSDLMERCIVYETKAPSTLERMTEEEFDERFYALLPSLLGQIFTVLSKVLEMHKDVKSQIKEKPRMADFAVYGECISRALGYDDFSFIEDYAKKLEQSSIGMIEDHQLADAISKIMESNEKYEDTVQNFFERARQIVMESGKELGKDFPAASNKVQSKVDRIKPNLRILGFEISFNQYTKNDEVFPKNRTIIKIEKNSSVISTIATEHTESK